MTRMRRIAISILVGLIIAGPVSMLLAWPLFDGGHPYLLYHRQRISILSIEAFFALVGWYGLTRGETGWPGAVVRGVQRAAAAALRLSPNRMLQYLALSMVGVVIVLTLREQMPRLQAVASLSVLACLLLQSLAAIKNEVTLDRVLRGCCIHCDYNLAGNQSGTCPECGKAVAVGRGAEPQIVQVRRVGATASSGV